jgi:predicted negative regulator of RcsB-dependent stress response
MADELGTTSSYSDPFYDRLEAFANVIKRSWLLVLVVMILCVAGVFTLTWAQQRHPDAGSAARFITARDEQDVAKRTAAYQALIADPTVTAVFRARAGIEVASDLLAKGDTASAAPVALKASADASASGDVDVQLAAKLSVAAVHEQAGELDPAVTAYSEAKRVAGVKYPVSRLTAELGLAQVLMAQGKRAEALAELEPVIVRNDAGAEQLIGLAKAMYWDLKRTLAEASAAPAAPVVEPAPVAPAVPANSANSAK